jgi:hypothetical protein
VRAIVVQLVPLVGRRRRAAIVDVVNLICVFAVVVNLFVFPLLLLLLFLARPKTEIVKFEIFSNNP